MAINGKPRIIIWFVTNDGRYIVKAGNILEQQFNGVEIVGVTANEKISINEAPFIPLNEISMNGGGYDILLVAGARNLGMSEVVKLADAVKLATDKLLPDWIVGIPGFTLQKYRKLQRSKLSIFSMSCFGGIISNFLGLPFRSPFINISLKEDEYIKFLRSPRVYMDENLVFFKKGFEANLRIEFPIYLLGDIFLYMNHYPNFDEALKKWYERKQRINWYNLFVIGYTENPEILEQFDELPYGKKVCFVPFKSDLDSAFYVNLDLISNLSTEDIVPLWKFVNSYANGEFLCYDMFDMLLYGKKTPLVDM